MGWLFGQVWLLCVVAFLAGAAVTWLAFVRPQRGAVPSNARGETWMPVPGWASGGEPAGREAAATPAPPVGPPAADPALAALDLGREPRSGPGPGVTATGALDMLGVARRAAPAVPEQARPAEGSGDQS